MDFVERICGVSPDAGSGILEVCLLLVPFGLLVLLSVARARQAQRQQRR